MKEFIEKDLQTLEILAAKRSENLVEYTLEAYLDMVEDKKNVIDALFESAPNTKSKYKGVHEFISKYIMELMDGKMLVNEYIEKNKAKQQVWLFIGTHWEVIEMQLFYVFVKRCASILGLADIYCNDPEFMGHLYLRLLFRLMEYRKQKVTPGDVWINCSNGTLEIRKDATFVLREHRPEDFFTYVLSYAYCPDNDCPMWRAFLDKVIPEENMQLLLAEFIGYCFTKDLKLEKMGVFYGTGSNGKSVTLDVITMLLGSTNVSNVTLSALTIDDEKRSMLEGKLANISHESKGELDTAMLKQIVSGEPTNVRKLYIGSYDMKDIPKLFTSYNRLPSAEYTFGFFRRWLLFPFKVTIPESEQDVDLVKKLSTELSGILNWVLGALTGLVQRKAFSKSKTCDQAVSDYINSSNSAMRFLSDVCIVDTNASTKLSDLYKVYATYCLEDDSKKIGKKNFQEIIESFGAKATFKHNAKYYNLKFKEDGTD